MVIYARDRPERLRSFPWMRTTSTNWVAIAAIIATPVTTAIGGLIGFLFGGRRDRAADQRRFDYDRRARAADDLIVLLDEIARALEALRAACADLLHATGDPDGFALPTLVPLFQTASDRYHAASAEIARMRLRPGASDETISLAQDAADGYRAGISEVGTLLLADMLGEEIEIEMQGLNGRISESLAAGVNKTRGFEAGARSTVGALRRA